MKFSGAMIGSDNPDGLGAFYTQVLGEPGFHDGEWYGWFQLGQLMIGPHSEVHGRNDRPERLMLMLEVEDVKASYDEIVAFGAPTIAAPYQPGGEDVWLATVADPDGNYVQLMSPWQGMA